MKSKDIHVGDVLQIRSFEDMKAEYGVDIDGCVHKDGLWFGGSMLSMCGRQFTIARIRNKSCDDYLSEYLSEEGVEDNECGGTWGIMAWMLEPYRYEELEPASDDEIISLISGGEVSC